MPNLCAVTLGSALPFDCGGLPIASQLAWEASQFPWDLPIALGGARD